MEAQEREFAFTHSDFDFLRAVANRCTGIVLKEDKYNMMYSRLARRIRFLGLSNFREYCEYLSKHEEDESIELVNALTTNLTSFFREQHHFDYLRDELVPRILQKNYSNKRIRIWSSACSTGEEPYSIAIALQEALKGNSGWDVKILATDIDSNVLAKGHSGIYDASRIEGLPKSLVSRWFHKGLGEHLGQVKVDPKLQEIIQFKQLNLLNEWPFKGPFDAIFCRNVIIYFDKETKTKLVERFVDYMHADSLLFLGHSESLFRVTDKFNLLEKTIYSVSG